MYKTTLERQNDYKKTQNNQNSSFLGNTGATGYLELYIPAFIDYFIYQYQYYY